MECGKEFERTNRKFCSDGKFRCKKCRKRIEHVKNYNGKRRDKTIAYQKEYRKINKETWTEAVKKWKTENRDYYREQQTIYARQRRKEDINFKLRGNLSCRINYALRKKTCKAAKTMDLTGCSIEELKKHLEKQFQDDMTWDNYGKWEVDHIKPCAAFNLIIEEEQKIAFHYTNLQPLWATDNKKKGAR